VRSVEFHPEAQAELISAARFFEGNTVGLGVKFIRFSVRLSGYRRFPIAAAASGSISAVYSFRVSLTVFSIGSNLIASSSSLSCIFTAGRDTGGHACSG